MNREKKALLSEIMSELGRKGGKIGGKRSLETMTLEERSAREEGIPCRGSEANGGAPGTGGRAQANTGTRQDAVTGARRDFSWGQPGIEMHTEQT